MGEASKVLEFTRLNKNGDQIEHRKYEIGENADTEKVAREVLLHLREIQVIPLAMPPIEYNNSGLAFSFFFNDRLPLSLIMSEKWRDDIMALLKLIDKVLKKKKDLFIVIMTRDKESLSDWEEVSQIFDTMFPNTLKTDSKEVKILLTAFEVMEDAIEKFVVPEDRITVEITEK